MGINRIVQFQFKPDTSSDAIEKVSAKIQEMRDKCLHPDSKKPYIQSIQGGADSAPEGLQVKFSQQAPLFTSRFDQHH
ncbi:stress responsive A B barrel domain-containing protein [Fusarium napiforme]|uniref:Stress responsive A B barrel domain-containing protein n=1 Tax=Fusarium napiforme TaxID=42672 RepID=A0A8H5JU37_9HYPO|nr:stress responsive A B barrel domain-containing protein [Fusarium napiforme]